MTISEKTRSKCRECKVDLVYFKTKRGKWMPIEAEPIIAEGDEKNVYNNEGELIKKAEAGTKIYLNHWGSCPAAKKFRKKK